MTDYYPIVEVRHEWIDADEAMGTKDKFWFRRPAAPEPPWLFKYPRPGTGEHWSEKIAAETASLLEIPYAAVELAELYSDANEPAADRGSISQSFVSPGNRLHHGNQILSRLIVGYDPDLPRFQQSKHTFGNILTCLDALWNDAAANLRVKRTVAHYLVFDALVGNTDRHSENWGVLLDRSNEVVELAPAFDHASSLGRELLDPRREQMLSGNRVGAYSERGRGGIYWAESDRRGVSPLQLARLAAQAYPELFLPALRQLQSVSREGLAGLADRVPDDWITPLARQFAGELLCYNYDQLDALGRELSQ